MTYNAKAGRLEGFLEKLYQKRGQDHVPNRHAFYVTGIFSDLKHHEMGDGFKEIDFGGVSNTIWRTPPLWGVGSSFPWGHDGQSLTLEDVILHHGGEAAAARANWVAAGPGQQKKVLDLLHNLVLYDIESLPADINGDGVIETNFMVAGRDTGVERFNAEWLFETPLQIQGLVNVQGKIQTSFAGVDIDQAYGQLLPLRIDSDADGWPDVWDNAPGSPGYKDGVN